MTDLSDPGPPAAGHPPRWPGRTPRPTIPTIAVVAALALGGVALGLAVSSTSANAVAPAPVSCSSTTPKLTVQGSGQATVTPDLLTVVLSVNAAGPSATAAMAADNVKVTGAVAALRGGGVEAKDIQTSGLSLQPQYAYPKGVPTVTGYQVTNSVTATLRDTAKAGAVIDAVVGAAGDAVSINSISFSRADPTAGEDKARSQAVAQAVSHAKAMAATSARSLGPVCSLTDQTQSTPPDLSQHLFSDAASGTAGVPAVPIETGTQAESAQITLVYALEPLRAHHR